MAIFDAFSVTPKSANATSAFLSGADPVQWRTPTDVQSRCDFQPLDFISFF